MSGLVCLYHRDGRPIDRESLEAMLAAASHRALDGCAIWTDPAVGLGYGKTAITLEEQRERQPLISARTGCVIVADARLDNRMELLAELAAGLSPTISDADLILLAYETWGMEAPPRLLGDFAFVIWDPRTQRLVCARDTSGERSLFYRVDQYTFAAASEIQQLLQDPAITIAPNEERIRDYLTPYRVFRNDQEQHATFFEGIFAVPAGHLLSIDASGHRLHRYWELTARREIRYRRPAEYLQHFASLFGVALGARLRAAGPIGAMLSGGLDSASIVCLAHLLYQQDAAENHGFATFGMVFPGMDCDESAFIHDVEAKCGFESYRVLVADRVAQLEPTASGFLAAPVRAVAEVDLVLAEAARAGVRTLLSGHLGDNCFGLWLHPFDGLIRRWRFESLWREVQAYRAASGERLRKIAALYCLLPLLPVQWQRPLRSAYLRRKLAHERADLLPSWIAEGMRDDLLEREEAMRLGAEQNRRFSSVEREEMFATLYPPEVMWTAGASPVQLVRPFSDRRLHEFLLAVPAEELSQPNPYAMDPLYGGAKLLLRRSMMRVLPESVRTRTHKTNFNSLFLHEIERRWDAYQAMFGPSRRAEVVARGYVDGPRFWDRLGKSRAGIFDLDSIYVMRVLYLETWLQTFNLPRLQRVTVNTVAASTSTQRQGVLV
ncbi:MAG: hypothetical protein QOF51_813 [Chloroflexota bacterium]|jgi:asparagine synthase (glutamine-hydrolysing)|nr:hypothetical protein [Chloroflexota bacterium]